MRARTLFERFLNGASPIQSYHTNRARDGKSAAIGIDGRGFDLPGAMGIIARQSARHG